jgi:hypothetical protein
MARAVDQVKWMREQHGTFDAALAKLRSQRAEFESRTLQAAR